MYLTVRSYQRPAIVTVRVIEPDVLLTDHIQCRDSQPRGAWPIERVECGDGMFNGVPQAVGTVLPDCPPAIRKRSEVDFGSGRSTLGDDYAVLGTSAESQAGGVQPEEQCEFGSGQQFGRVESRLRQYGLPRMITRS